MERFLEGFAHGQLVFFTLDDQCRIVEISARNARTFGMSISAMESREIWSLYPELRESEFFDHCQAVLKHKGSVAFQAVGGRDKHFNILVSAFSGGVAVHIQNVTRQVVQEQDLRAKENLLHAIFEAVPFWLTVKDTDLRYLMVNERMLRAQGLKKEDFLHLHVLDLPMMRNEEMEVIMEMDKKALSNPPEPVVYESAHTLINGGRRVFQTTKVPFFNHEDQVGGVVTVSMDITMEKEIIANLSESQRSLSLAQDLAGIGSWDLDIASGKMNWTEGIYKIIGETPQTMEPTYENFMGVIDPADFEAVAHFMEQARKTEQPNDIEHRMLRRDGGEVVVCQRTVVVKDKEDHPMKVLGVVQDLTRQKEAEGNLRGVMARLERSNKDLEYFATVASHDLQEPLRKITAFGERLQSKYADALSGDGLDYLERMLNASGRMRVLIDDLLAYSRVTTKGRDFEPTPLNEVLHNVLEDLEMRIEDAGATVEIADLPTLNVDKMQFHQLFQNLLMNALKYSREGVVPKIRVYPGQVNGHNGKRPSLPDGAFQLFVEDNGIGFEQKYAERIFTIFQRLHGRGKYEGTGIGLALCRKIVVRHGGNITALGRPGEGSKFIINLPREILRHGDGT